MELKYRKKWIGKKVKILLLELVEEEGGK